MDMRSTLRRVKVRVRVKGGTRDGDAAECRMAR